MKTTLDYFCKSLGWQGGTIHEAKRRFAIASLKEQDHICGVLVDNIKDISDVAGVLYFTRKRLDALRLHTNALTYDKAIKADMVDRMNILTSDWIESND